jgi:hypothetical protein
MTHNPTPEENYFLARRVRLSGSPVGEIDRIELGIELARILRVLGNSYGQDIRDSLDTTAELVPLYDLSRIVDELSEANERARDRYEIITEEYKNRVTAAASETTND